MTNMRARQLAHRTRRPIPIRVLAAGIRPHPPAGWRGLASGLGVDAAPSSGPGPPPHRDGIFRAVGAHRRFAEPAYWTDPRDGLLFLFQLHGFAELAAYAAGPSSKDGDDYWRAVVADWLHTCGRPILPAWRPYPTSVRIVAWCAALSRDGWLDDLRPAMLRSLSAQVRLLRRCVEHDIGGNHVVRNASALVVAGACLQDRVSLRRGVRLLGREVAEQVLPDGGHEERSPSYHRLVLGDLLDARTALGRAGTAPPPSLGTTIERMRGWLRSIAGPGGDIPPLNDGWDGPPLTETANEPITHLAASGYVVLREGDSQALFDAGPVAPAHLPAHAHADALSLLMWVEGKPLIVDCGSGSYAGPERTRFRSTAAHNTVEIDGADQCDLWGPFRAAFMPKVEPAQIESLDGALLVRSAHDGYRRLPDPVVHERTLVWLGQDGAVVIDRLRCVHPHRVTSRLHFSESVERPLDALPGGLVLRPLPPGPGARSESGARSPYLGRAIPIAVVEWEGQVGPGEPCGWSITRPGVDVRVEGATVVIQPTEGGPVRLSPS